MTRKVREQIVVVVSGGRLRFVYRDRLAGLLTEGPATIRRASHVEPAPGGGWTADPTPVRGPALGPFRTRAAALAAEVRYLTRHL